MGSGKILEKHLEWVILLQESLENPVWHMKDYYSPGTKWEYVWHDWGIVSKALWLMHDSIRMMNSQKLGTNFEGLLIFTLNIFLIKNLKNFLIN